MQKKFSELEPCEVEELRDVPSSCNSQPTVKDQSELQTSEAEPPIPTHLLPPPPPPPPPQRRKRSKSRSRVVTKETSDSSVFSGLRAVPVDDFEQKLQEQNRRAQSSSAFFFANESLDLSKNDESQPMTPNKNKRAESSLSMEEKHDACADKLVDLSVKGHPNQNLKDQSSLAMEESLVPADGCAEASQDIPMNADSQSKANDQDEGGGSFLDLEEDSVWQQDAPVVEGSLDLSASDGASQPNADGNELSNDEKNAPRDSYLADISSMDDDIQPNSIEQNQYGKLSEDPKPRVAYSDLESNLLQQDDGTSEAKAAPLDSNVVIEGDAQPTSDDQNECAEDPDQAPALDSYAIGESPSVPIDEDSNQEVQKQNEFLIHKVQRLEAENNVLDSQNKDLQRQVNAHAETEVARKVKDLEEHNRILKKENRELALDLEDIQAEAAKTYTEKERLRSRVQTMEEQNKSWIEKLRTAEQDKKFLVQEFCDYFSLLERVKTRNFDENRVVGNSNLEKWHLDHPNPFLL